MNYSLVFRTASQSLESEVLCGACNAARVPTWAQPPASPPATRPPRPPPKMPARPPRPGGPLLPPPLPRQQAPRPPQAPPSSGPVTPWPPRHGPWLLSFKHQWWGLCFLPPSWAPGCCVLAGQGHKGPSRTLSLTFSSGEGPAWGAAGGLLGASVGAQPVHSALCWQGRWRPGGYLVRVSGPRGQAVTWACFPTPHPLAPPRQVRGRLSFSPGYSFGANLAPEGTCKWLFAPHRKTSLSVSEDVSRNSLYRPPTCSSPSVAGWPRPQESGGRARRAHPGPVATLRTAI